MLALLIYLLRASKALRRACFSPAVVVDLVLFCLPFWPSGLLPADITSYLGSLVSTVRFVGRGRLG